MEMGQLTFHATMVATAMLKCSFFSVSTFPLINFAESYRRLTLTEFGSGSLASVGVLSLHSSYI